MYTKEQFCKLIDHTFLQSTGTREDILKFCEECRTYHFAAAVVFPFWLPLVKRELENSDVKICAPIGFPYGMTTRASKVHEARNAVANGADEIEVVMNLGALKSGDYDFVRREISDIISAVNISGISQESKRTLIKIIIETPYLTDREKIIASRISIEAGADFIQTSTDTAPSGPTLDDIWIIRSIVGPATGVKAVGRVRTMQQALSYLDAGANRVGTSVGVAIVQDYASNTMIKSSR